MSSTADTRASFPGESTDGRPRLVKVEVLASAREGSGSGAPGRLCDQLHQDTTAVPPSNAEAVNKIALRVDRRSCSNRFCRVKPVEADEVRQFRVNGSTDGNPSHFKSSDRPARWRRGGAARPRTHG